MIIGHYLDQLVRLESAKLIRAQLAHPSKDRRMATRVTTSSRCRDCHVCFYGLTRRGNRPGSIRIHLGPGAQAVAVVLKDSRCVVRFAPGLGAATKSGRQVLMTREITTTRTASEIIDWIAISPLTR
jgi:hypothetical protein